MPSFISRKFHKKMVAIAVTSALAATPQNSFAASSNDTLNPKAEPPGSVIQSLALPVSNAKEERLWADQTLSQQKPLFLEVTDTISASRSGFVDISTNKEGATDLNITERSDAMLLLNGGRIGQVIGNENDFLFLLRGSIDTAERFQTVTVSGSDWIARRPFTNISAVSVNSTGALKELHIYGPKAPEKPINDQQTLGFTTKKGQRMEFVAQAGSQFGAINIYDQASLGDIYINNGQVDFMVDNKASFELGRIINASVINASDFEFNQVLVGKDLQQIHKDRNLVVNTSQKNSVNLSLKKITTLQLNKGANLTGNISNVENIQILGSDFVSTGWINAKSLTADVAVDTVNISGSIKSIKPEKSQLNIHTTNDEPFTIRSNQLIHNISRLNILDNANINTIDSVKEVQIKGSGWRAQGTVHNLDTLNILPNGVADKIMVVGSGRLEVPQAQAMHVHFDEHKTYHDNDIFTIKNVGGMGTTPGLVKVLDFSANVNRPKIMLVQQGGHAEKAIGHKNANDELVLIKGQLTQATGFNTITLAGSQWGNTLAINPLKINHTAREAGALSVRISATPIEGQGTLALFYTEESTPVKLESLGTIKEIDLASVHDRPAFIITQKGASVDSITGDISKPDQFTAYETTVKQLSDLATINFMGSNSYEGDHIQSSGSINVFKELHFKANRTTIAPGTPGDKKTEKGAILEIHEQATATTPSELIVDGTYRQQGRLILTDNTPHSGRLKPLGTKGEKSVVQANSVVIEPGAKFVFDSVIMKEPAEGKQYLLMEAHQSNINRPVKVEAKHEMHLHYDAIIDPKNPKKMLLTTTRQSEHRSKLVSKGLRSMIIAATDNTDANKLTVNDNNKMELTRYIVQNINAKSSNAAAAKLTPSLSPHASYNANLALKMAGKNLDQRMSAKHTGVSTGLNSGDLSSNSGAWVQYSYNKANQKKQGYIPGYEAKINGFSIGVDNGLAKNPNIETGLAYTYARGDTHQRGQPENTIDSDAHIFTLYTSSINKQLFIDSRVSYALGKNKGSRTVNNSQNDAKYDTKSWDIGLTTGYNYMFNDDWNLQPQIAFNYLTIKTEDYTESARNPTQVFLSFDQVNNDRYHMLELGGGLKVISNMNAGDLHIKPEISLMGFHDFKKDPITVTAHFADGGESFLIHGAKKERNRYQFDAVVNMAFSNTALTLRYSHHWATGFKVNGLHASMRYRF